MDKQVQGLVCRACQRRIGIIDAETGVCPLCSKKRIGEVFRPAFEIMRKAYSLLPGDSHLEIVLATWGTREWVVWLHNKERNDYGEGRYWTTYENAVEDFCQRGNLPPRMFSVMVFVTVEAHSPRKAEDIVRHAINTLDTTVDIQAVLVGNKKEEGN